MRDRLESLHTFSSASVSASTASNNQDGRSGEYHTGAIQASPDEHDQFMADLESVTADIKHSEKLIDEIELRYRGIISAEDDLKMQRSQAAAEHLTAEFTSLGDTIRSKLRKISADISVLSKQDDAESDSDDGNGHAAQQLKKYRTILQNRTRRFLSSVQLFETTSGAFQKRRQKQMADRLRLVRPLLSDRQVQQLIERGVPEDDRLFSPAHSPQLLSGELVDAHKRQAVGERDWMEARRAEMAQLEMSMQQLAQLMQDVTLLISQQGQVIDQMESYLEGAADYTHKGRGQVDVMLQKAALRQRQRFWTTVITFVAVVVFLIVAFILIKYQIFSEIVSMVYVAVMLVVCGLVFYIYRFLSPSRWFGKKKKKGAMEVAMESLNCCNV